MARTTIVKLTDDISGGDANETILFTIDGRAYEIDLNEANAASLREALALYIEKGRPAPQAPVSGGQRGGSSGSSTLFSTLGPDEKTRFRKWADMPKARRVADSRVQDWIDTGRP
jgi:hypothetical protein